MQRLSEACKAHQADRELSSADSNILELDAVVRRRQAVRAFRALDLLHCQRPSAFTRDPSSRLSPVSAGRSYRKSASSRCLPWLPNCHLSSMCTSPKTWTLPRFWRIGKHSPLNSRSLSTSSMICLLTATTSCVCDFSIGRPTSNSSGRNKKKRSLTAQLEQPFDFF